MYTSVDIPMKSYFKSASAWSLIFAKDIIQNSRFRKSMRLHESWRFVHDQVNSNDLDLIHNGLLSSLIFANDIKIAAVEKARDYMDHGCSFIP